MTYLIDPAVDIYKIDNDVLEFYFITTRRRVTMEVSEDVISLIHSLTIDMPIENHLSLLGIEYSDNVKRFLDYLVHEKILYVKSQREKDRSILSEYDRNRYDRQICFFESMFHNSAYTIQERLRNTRFVIFGVGAIGAGIAQQLAMCGVCHFVLVDKDILSKDSIERHFFFQERFVGKPKVEALSNYLKDINHEVDCVSFFEMVDYDSNLDKYLDDADFVVNTMDEPYIGVTSMKIGRECYGRNLPLYVAGGFDAHLMSTGELIVPNVTPCVDCYTSYFTNVLKEWKPQYNINAVDDIELANNRFQVGGLSSMSLFSISYAVVVIVNYLASHNADCGKGRGELLFDSLNIEYINISRNPRCYVCGA